MINKKKIAVYPGSFNPLHQGHIDVLKKALAIFDEVVIAIDMGNKCGVDITKLKQVREYLSKELKELNPNAISSPIQIMTFNGLLSNLIKERNWVAIVRGLRNGNDLQYERNLLYWYEDLGVNIPIVHFITDRKYSHISSSAIREIEAYKND